MSGERSGEIHGHEVINMMEESGQGYTRESLLEAIHEKFGKEARFYICSGGQMTAGELIRQLAAKGKFRGSEEAFRFDRGARCDH